MFLDLLGRCVFEGMEESGSEGLEECLQVMFGWCGKWWIFRLILFSR